MNTSLSLNAVHRLSFLPPIVLAQMVARQTSALEGLLRGGADGSTSGDRMLNAVTTLEDAMRLEQVAADWADYGGQMVVLGPDQSINWAAKQIDPQTTISPRVSAACLIAVIGIIAAHWAWSATL